MKKQPNPNLWSVDYSSKWSPTGANESLWILAPSAGLAEAKAKRHLAKSGETRVRITSIKHRGTIDVF